MSFNGSGTFVINSSGQPVVANTVISTTVFNALTADLATGLSTCITKDGQTTPTANIPMGTFKLTGLGVGSAATDSATLGQVQASTTKLITVLGTDTITGTLSPGLTAYTAGQMFYFVAGGANTGAVTLNIDGLGVKNMTRHGSVALVAGDILSGEVCVVVYDGTRFQLLNPASYTNLNVSGVLSLAAGTALLPSLAFTGDPNTGMWSPAADTIAFSEGGVEAMRLDSSGNIGIGTSSPASFGKLAVVGGNIYLDNANGALTIRNADLTNQQQVRLRMSGTDAVLDTARNSGAAPNLIFGTESTERMRLDSSGNLGIGTSSPARKLDVNGTVRIAGGQSIEWGGTSLSLAGSSDTFQFFTSSAERMRIDANGNIVAGASAALATNATNGFLYVPTCAGTPTGTPTAITGMAPIVVDTTNNKLYFYSSGVWRDAGP
jgi:hypothetical protein